MGKPLKGGVWTNVEDEVLKAAIMKYGTNQWARVASLINRKSAAQCKARWYDWLSPTVKKTEWTQEENEKLLHLAKIMPTQWRTISDMIGRTSTQCYQQYCNLTEKKYLRDQHGDYSNLKAEDSVDIRPESRPAKPDPIDMAEDQIDMLSEARARLANTQGKKAKRKGRERQLIMARRLASVQQKRELSEVGINPRNIINKKKPGINYNDEIPFYQPIPRGFHDTANEKLEVEEKVIGKRVSELEFESREDREKRERKKDADLKRKKEDENLPEVIKNATNADLQVKRAKLDLPAPKMDDEEFQNIWKQGRERSKFLDSEWNTGQDETKILLSQHLTERQESSKVLATPTPLTVNNRIEMEVQNLRALHYTDNPLLGGENPQLHDIKTVETHNRNFDTPNTSLRSNILGTPMQESSFSTPTIGKDGLRFNVEHKQKVVQNSLSKLPTPKEVELKSINYIEDVDFNSNNLNLSGRIEDQAEIDKRLEDEIRKNEERLWELRSSVIKRDFPRPYEVNHSILRPADSVDQLNDTQRADELVKREMLRMLHYDNMKNPVEIDANGKYREMSRNERRKLSTDLNQSNLSNFAEMSKELGVIKVDEEFSSTELEYSRKLLNEEMAVVKKEMHQTQPSSEINLDGYSKVWLECLAQVLYLPNEKRFTRANLVNKKDRIESCQKLFEMYLKQYNEMNKSANKKENKLTILLNGYITRAKLLVTAISNIYDQTEISEIELNSLRKMQTQEQGAIKRRLEALEIDVERQRIRENTLQNRYAELKKKRDMLTPVQAN